MKWRSDLSAPKYRDGEIRASDVLLDMCKFSLPALARGENKKFLVSYFG